jgi:protease I
MRSLVGVLGLCLLGPANAKPTLWDEQGTEVAAVREESPPHPELMRFLLQKVQNPEQLRGYRVAVLVSDGVDGFELFIAQRFLSDRGASVHVVVPRPASGYSRATSPRIAVLNPSGEEDVAVADRFLDQVQARDYDAIYVPSNRAQLRRLEQAAGARFLQQAARSGTPVFATGNGALVLWGAGLLDRRRVAADAATLDLLRASSVHASDAPFAVDGPIRTSRDAFAMPALVDSLIETLLLRPPARD